MQQSLHGQEKSHKTFQNSHDIGIDYCWGSKAIFFYRLKVFIGPKLREVSIGNVHRKAPKWAKNQVKVSKIDQIRPPLHPTYCGNPPILSSELLWESINSFIRPTVGIHFGNFSIRPTVGIHQFLHRSCCGNPIINKWIPTAAPMTEFVDSHSRSDAKGVLFCQFLTL